MLTAEEARRRIEAKQGELRAAIADWIAVTGGPFIPWTPQLQVHQVAGCVVLASRYHLLDILPKGGVCIELGTQLGTFAREILDRTKPAEFHVVDLCLRQLFKAETFEEELASGRLAMHEGDSSTVLAAFPDRYFDWIYIDADHSYQGVKKDLAVAVEKIKDGGLIICNDYTQWSPTEASPYGIMRAVHELCRDQDWEFVYLAIEAHGFHDVCLRKVTGRRPREAPMTGMTPTRDEHRVALDTTADPSRPA